MQEGWLAEFAKKISKNVVIDYNKKQHQKGGSECGVYCLHFIISMIEGKDFYEFNKTRISDEEVGKIIKGEQ